MKFIGLGELQITKNGTGILAFINPHGFLDNPTFRGMRWHLLKSFDEIYCTDLHGNSKKKETAIDGSVDENVFDIMQGVAITVFVRKKINRVLGNVFHFDLLGKRQLKYDFLISEELKTISFQEMRPIKPYLFFVPKSNIGAAEYDNGFKVNEIFPLNTSGMVTANDSLSIFMTENELKKTTDEILTSSNPYVKFDIKDTRRVSKEMRLVELRNARKNGSVKVNYKPFDIQYMYHTKNNEHWINSPRNEVMQHFILGENIGLVIARQCADDWKYIFCTKVINVFNLTGTAGRYGSGNTFPLYLYPINKDQQTIEQETERMPNLNAVIVKQIALNLGLVFINEKEKAKKTFAPIDILDYIYAVLYSPTYREKYNEFLKIDFPRVPYPKNKETFWELVSLGSEIRQIHLLESPVVNSFITQYPIKGDNLINKKTTFDDGKVWMNKTQYFENVPQVAWEFYIGGYQPAQKWLNDRKGRELNEKDINHYQKIIVALNETDRIIKEIDKIEIE